MDLIRVGNKLISREKTQRHIDRILQLRVEGYSQQEVGKKLNIDRTFISRLEALGEVRRGQRVAVVGFPILNKHELQESLLQKGVEYILLFTEEERWQFVDESEGIELLNKIMTIITELKNYDAVIMIGSNYRIRLCEALLDKEVVGVEIGKSPIEEDKHVPVHKIQELVEAVMVKTLS
ncbi:MAG: transcriptional regulator [Clostridia bacterium]|nr:transcriptional regulator [Clostridia bacterium]